MENDIKHQIWQTQMSIDVLDEQIQYVMRRHLENGCTCFVSKCRWENMLENRKLYYELKLSLEEDLKKLIDSD